jgi:hypothetical protein
VDLPTSLLTSFGQRLEEVLWIHIIQENILTAIASTHHIIFGVRSAYLFLLQFVGLDLLADWVASFERRLDLAKVSLRPIARPTKSWPRCAYTSAMRAGAWADANRKRAVDRRNHRQS